jgi:lysophospholipase L1-like esterase
MPTLSRRQFMATAGGASGAALLSGCSPLLSRIRQQDAGTVVLFQGDSITDAGRNRDHREANQRSALGTGYSLLVASLAMADHPTSDLRFYNRGISGDKVPDLQARWQQDTLDLRPDVLSILIGVNDMWHKLAGRYAGTVADYERQYLALLQNTRQALPGTRILVMEPFVTRTGAVDQRWFPEFDHRRAAAARVAREAGVDFLPLQEVFDGLSASVSPAHWADDGVHPTAAGHAVIARRWRDAIGM